MNMRPQESNQASSLLSRFCAISREGIRLSWLIFLATSWVIISCGGESQKRASMGRARYVTQAPPASSIQRCVATAPSRPWAVVIGVNAYQDPRIPDLEGAVLDAWNVYHYLISPLGGKIDQRHARLLLNEEATKENVEEALGQFLRGSCPQDLITIYFAGHGAPEPDDPDEPFLLLHNTRLDAMVSTAIAIMRSTTEKFVTIDVVAEARL